MSVITLDVETEGLHHTAGLTTISFTNDHRTIAFAVNHKEMEGTEKDALDKIQRIIDKADVLVAHKASFEIKHLLNAGIDLKDKLFVCTKGLYWLYTGHVETKKKTSLSNVAKALLRKDKVEGYDFSKKKASTYPLKGLLHYNSVDTKLTHEIYNKLIDQVPPEMVKFYSDINYLFAKVEMNGMKVNEDRLQKLLVSTEARLEVYKKQLLEQLEYPINPNSGPQLSVALYGGTFKVTNKEIVRQKFKTWPLWRWKTSNVEREVALKGLGFGTSKLKPLKSGAWPTDTATILSLKGRTKKAKEWLEEYKEFNKWNTLYTKYISKYAAFLIDGYVHSNFNLYNTKTGRTSSSSPNVQQLPRVVDGMPNVKEIFVSRFENGVLLDVDFSGAEWRIAAHLCECDKMIQRILDGVCAHKYMASRPEVFNVPYKEVTGDQRQDAKSMNFGVIYGQSPWGFAFKRDDIPSITTEAQGKAFVNAAYKEMPGLKRWHDRQLAIARGKGKIVMETGRWYDFSGDLFVDRNIKNYPVQGLSFDMTMCCLIEADKRVTARFGDQALLINHVHDCGIWDCASKEIAIEVNKIVRNIFMDAAKYVKERFPNVDLSNVPMDSETEWGQDWGNMKLIEED